MTPDIPTLLNIFPMIRSCSSTFAPLNPGLRGDVEGDDIVKVIPEVGQEKY